MDSWFVCSRCGRKSRRHFPTRKMRIGLGLSRSECLRLYGLGLCVDCGRSFLSGNTLEGVVPVFRDFEKVK